MKTFGVWGFVGKIKEDTINLLNSRGATILILPAVTRVTVQRATLVLNILYRFLVNTNYVRREKTT